MDGLSTRRARRGHDHRDKRTSRQQNRGRISIDSLLRRLDIVELNDDTEEFRELVHVSGGALDRAVTLKDFSYSNFTQWRNASWTNSFK